MGIGETIVTCVAMFCATVLIIAGAIVWASGRMDKHMDQLKKK
jgi:hypothetical protein